MTFDHRKSAILIITPYHKHARGNTLTSERLHKGLQQRGWSVDLFSLESDNWQQMLPRIFRQNHYSLIHGLNITHFTRVLTSFPDLVRVPLLLTMTGTDVNYDMQVNSRPEIADTLNMVRHIVIFDDYFKTIFKKYYPESVSKLVTIPQGVSLEPHDELSRSQLGLGENDFVFLLPSGLRPVKNLEFAIDALETLVPHFFNLRLAILGAIIDHQYSNFIMKRIHGLPWVAYPGEFPHSQMYSLLQLGDVVLNTSHHEGQPQAALEAMSLSKPCLLTPVPGNLNTITHGREGYYVKNQADLAAAARKLMLNQELRKNMGASARRLVQKRYSLEKELDAYEVLYQKMLADCPER